MQLQFRVEGKGAMQLKAILLLARTGCTVGRGGVPFALRRDDQCSRRHALIYEGVDGEIWVKDLDSRNGTWVNGKRVQRAQLRIGDILRVGYTVLVLTNIEKDRSDSAGVLPWLERPSY